MPEEKAKEKPNDLEALGDAFVRLGVNLKRGSDTGLDAETLNKFLTLGRLIPEPFAGRANAPWSEDKDPSAITILERIRKGEPIPSDKQARKESKELLNTLLRLKRNGLIVNRGSRTKPKWCVSTEEERLQITQHFKDRRRTASN